MTRSSSALHDEDAARARPLTRAEREWLREEIDRRTRDRHSRPHRDRREGGTRDRLLTAFRELGRATCAEAARRSGIANGSTQGALRSLLAQGAIRQAGLSRNGRVEYELAE